MVCLGDLCFVDGMEVVLCSEMYDISLQESGRMPTKLDEMEMTLRETTVKIQYFRKVVIDAKNEEDTAKVGYYRNRCSPTLTKDAT